MGKQQRMMPSHPEIELDDLDPLEDAFDQLVSSNAAVGIGELDPNQELRRRDRADRDVIIFGEQLSWVRPASLKGDQSPAVEDQSFHGSVPGALPTNRRRSARSSSQP